MTRPLAAAVFLLATFATLPIFAQQTQEAPTPAGWTFGARLELRANYRDSKEVKAPLKFPFPPSFLPVGQTIGFEETVNAGSHAELSVVQGRFDIGYGSIFQAHAQLHAQDKYRRNPTSEDRKTDADELWLRFGQNPQFLDRPTGTSLFLQVGKQPHLEREPIRLLESYGLVATAFDRFEDVQAIFGGSVGRNFYWRLIGANGNPLYFRDPNALAGDNGIKELLQPNPDPHLKSGFPILYNTETEDYFFNTEHFQFGQAVGYKWQNERQTGGFDAVLFHYRRKMVEEDTLTGTFYGADLDLLQGPFELGLPIHGNMKDEIGSRIYVEAGHLTSTIQLARQQVAGLQRKGYEVETGYAIPFEHGPVIGGGPLFRSIMPVLRVSGISNNFRDKANKQFPAPSVWWPWTKIDAGIRVTFARNIDVTMEHTKNNIGAPIKIDPAETLVTLRVRI